jgi:hypothetical protein
VSREALQSPPTEGDVGGAFSRTYLGAGGSPAGSVLAYAGAGGPPGIAYSLICASGATSNFTAAEWDRLSEPRSEAEEQDRTPTTVPDEDLKKVRAVLPPASIPSAMALCHQPLIETANGNADPIFCTGGSLNVEAWTYLASNQPTLFLLGPKATLAEVTAAMCADVRASINSTVISTYELAAAYFGWSFDEDPTAILYSDPGCPPA